MRRHDTKQAPGDLNEDINQVRSNEDAKSAREASKWKRTEVFKHKEKRIDHSLMHLSPIQIFFVFAILNTFAAIYSPILDCDEVFNFWEPTHYIDRGYGFQTWEYSPEFALRTWLYPAVHAVIAMIGRIGTIFATKTFQFYFTRFALGLICAICETRLYAQVCRTLNASIGLILALVLAVSPGMFHASVALLPSSFAMYMVMLAIASFLDWRGGPHTAQGIFWLGAGSVFAWPFLGILILPFMGEEAFIATYSPNFDEAWRDLATRILYGITRITILGGFEFFFDLSMYRKYVFFPWNLVKYNVLSAVEGKGPSIFGTEPWHWYLQNLSINFNLWFLLALLAGPLLFHQTFILRRPTSKASWIREFTVISPLYLWLAIFTVQPHKEERFMYPIYPAIVLNAAISAHILLVNIGSRSRGQGVPVISALPANLRLLLIGSIVSVAISLGGLRTVGLISAYGGPMSVYEPLHKHELANEADNVCIAKEWYRFPSSYHLPQGVRAKFVRSAFDGLLPGEFSEASSGFGLLPGAWLVPAGMNDRNIHDPGKYTEEEHCNFFVDSYFPGVSPTPVEPDRINNEDEYERIKCVPFLDNSRTSGIARTLYIPDWNIIPQRFRRKWGQYCLLKRRRNFK